MKKRIVLMLLPVFALSSIGALGQEPLSLSSAVTVALENNQMLRSAAHDLEAARWGKLNAITNFLPEDRDRGQCYKNRSAICTACECGDRFHQSLRQVCSASLLRRSTRSNPSPIATPTVRMLLSSSRSTMVEPSSSACRRQMPCATRANTHFRIRNRMSSPG